MATAGFYVYLSKAVWAELHEYPPMSKLLYIYLFSNTHVHYSSGIANIPDAFICAETGLSALQLKEAWPPMTDGDGARVFRDGSWYLVLSRMKHTCYTTTGQPHEKMMASARKYLASGEVPVSILDRLSIRYGKDIDRISRPIKREIEREREPKREREKVLPTSLSPKPSSAQEPDKLKYFLTLYKARIGNYESFINAETDSEWRRWVDGLTSNEMPLVVDEVARGWDKKPPYPRLELFMDAIKRVRAAQKRRENASKARQADKAVEEKVVTPVSGQILTLHMRLTRLGLGKYGGDGNGTSEHIDATIESVRSDGVDLLDEAVETFRREHLRKDDEKEV